MISIPDLERVAAFGWRAADEDRLGEWLLRAADGFTGRANSALAIGEPGMSLPAAIEEVTRWYGARGLPAMVAVPYPVGGPQRGGPSSRRPDQRGPEGDGREGSRPGEEALGDGGLAGGGLDSGEVDRYLRECGWGIRAHAATVLAAAPEAVTRRSAPAGVHIDLAPEPDDAWLDCYRYRGQELPRAALALLMSAPWQAFASARTGGQTVAVGRVAAGGGWAGLTAVEVHPGHRRQGLASALTASLADAAASQGVTGLYLQVEDENSAARMLYQRVGFAEHHGYHYRIARTAS
jgi:ribosomal protein S18 acetylase RimI-like enzyme